MTMRSLMRETSYFRVVDREYNGWNFWSAFANRSWEPSTLREVEIGDDALLFDIGAWVGPISLWAAAHGVTVVAVEPDPAALADLAANVEASGFRDQITIVPFGLAPTAGRETLMIQNGGGDSQSSMARTNMHDSIVVETLTLADLIRDHGVPDLVKIDVEGFEGFLLPAIGPELRRRRIPLLLSMHWQWLPEGTRAAVEEELSKWTLRTVESDSLYCQPR